MPEHYESRFTLFALMLPESVSAGTVEYQEIQAAGADFGNAAQPAYVVLLIQGDVYGMQTPPGVEVEHKILLDAQSAALMAAILIGQGEKIVGRAGFTAMLDQEISLVRQHEKG